jgi:hypothetical protein
MRRSKVRNPALPLAVLGLLLGGGACETIPGPDELGDNSQFSTDLSMQELSSTLDVEAARVELTLYRQGVVVRELEIKSPESLTNDERIEGRVVSVVRSDAGGYIELNIEGIRIEFNGDTRFTTREDDVDLDPATVLTRLQGAVADGARPAVEATRAAPDVPQSPDDEGFLANRIRLLGEGEGRILEMNIDRDNLVRNDDGFPDGWIVLLGREFEIRIREGITHLERERPNLVKEHFEGLIESVNLDNQSFVIKDGPEVRLLPHETEIRYEQGDEHRLGSLEAVARALDEGLRVFTAGVGIVESREPLKLIAIAVVFEVAPPPMEDFEGLIAAVDLVDSTVTLEGGLIIQVTSETHVRFEADHAHLLGTLEAVAEALEAGRKVVAAGVGVIVQRDPLIIEAVKIVFVVRPPPMEEFRGVVDEVNLIDSTVTLVGGTLILVKADTEIWFAELAEHQLGSLEAVAEAVAAGRRVVAAGFGEVQPEDPLVICAKKILFILEPPDLIAFHGVVRSVNMDAHTFTLWNGTVVRVNDETIVWFQANDVHSLRTLAAVAEAVGRGDTVVAAGVGRPDVTVSNAEGPRLLAVKVAFLIVPPGIQHFEGTVTSVDLTASTITLDHEVVVRVVEGTMFVHHDCGELLGSLKAVDEVVRNGGRVRATGMGLLETSEPFVLIAIAVAFHI